MSFIFSWCAGRILEWEYDQMQHSKCRKCSCNLPSEFQCEYRHPFLGESHGVSNQFVWWLNLCITCAGSMTINDLKFSVQFPYESLWSVNQWWIPTNPLWIPMNPYESLWIPMTGQLSFLPCSCATRCESRRTPAAARDADPVPSELPGASSGPSLGAGWARWCNQRVGTMQRLGWFLSAV